MIIISSYFFDDRVDLPSTYGIRQQAVSVISSRDLLESIGSNPAEYAEERNRFVLNERSDFFCFRNALKWIDTPELKSYVISIF